MFLVRTDIPSLNRIVNTGDIRQTDNRFSSVGLQLRTLRCKLSPFQYHRFADTNLPDDTARPVAFVRAVQYRISPPISSLR